MTRVDLQAILDAQAPEDVFGDLPEDATTQNDAVKGTYRTLLRAVHPDRNPDDEDDATKATGKLNELYRLALEAIEAGTYGQRATAANAVTIAGSEGTITVVNGFAAGDACAVFSGRYKGDGFDRPVLVKVPVRHADNDLLKHEQAVLEKVRAHAEVIDQKATERGEDKTFGGYIPTLYESLTFRHDGQTKRANIFEHKDRFFTLDQVREEYPPGSLHVKDMAWMFRRLLIAIGIAHRAGVVHGAILPQHVLIQPERHELMVIDWKYAAEAGNHIKAIPSKFKAWYPQEVLEKEKATPATDIYMAVRTMVHLLGGGAMSGQLPDSVPMPMRAFLKGCTQQNPRARPQDAWDILDEFDEVLHRLYGPRKFRKFYMP